MIGLTGMVITLNEERHIRACLETLFQICDEVIVVDSNSSDNTVDIAREMGAKTVIQEFLGDGPQRNFGVRMAKNDWILNLDADERMDEKAVACVKALDLTHTLYDGFAFNRMSFIGNTWMKVWFPDYVVRLYNKRMARSLPVSFHSKVDAKHVKKLPCAILHFAFEDYSDLVCKSVDYSAHSAKQLFEEGKHVSSFAPILHALITFLRKYVLKRGFLYGLDGLNISVISSFYTYMKYAFLLEMYKDEKGQ